MTKIFRRKDAPLFLPLPMLGCAVVAGMMAWWLEIPEGIY
jgi:hypothetical protein